jgi:hypothetical protein
MLIQPRGASGRKDTKGRHSDGTAAPLHLRQKEDTKAPISEATRLAIVAIYFLNLGALVVAGFVEQGRYLRSLTPEKKAAIAWTLQRQRDRAEAMQSPDTGDWIIASTVEFGCTGKWEYQRLAKILEQFDLPALYRGVEAGVRAGYCVRFKDSEEVSITDTSRFPDMIQVRPRGDFRELL